MILRPYQTEAIDAIAEKFQSHQSTLAVLATGTGKTVIFGHLIGRRANLGRSMVLAHRNELIEQAAASVSAVTGLKTEIEMADQWASDGTMFGGAPVVVSSVQSLNSSSRLDRFDPMKFSTLVCDEAHHGTADSYKKIFDHFRKNPNLKLLGVTATPDRKDEEALGQVFESVAYDYEIIDAVMDGWLVRPLCRTVKLAGLDLSGVRTVGNDFNQGQLAEELSKNQNLEAIAAATVEHSGDRSTIVFADSMTESTIVQDENGEPVRVYSEGNAPKICMMLNGHKPGSARLIHGGTPKEERKGIVDDFRAGRYQYLVGVGVPTEGFDAPETSCIVLGRPTKSRALCSQMCGRGTRPSGSIASLLGTLPNDVARREAIAASCKPNLLIVDFVDNTNRHDLIHPPDILGGRVSARAVELVERECQGMPVDVIESLNKAEDAIRHNDELAAAARSRQGVKAVSRSKDKDPFAKFGLVRKERRGWETDAPADDYDLAKLRKWKLIKEDQVVSQADAIQLIEEVRDRARNGKCSLGQKAILQRYGHDDGVSFEEAHAIIDSIAARGWKR